MHRIIIPLYLPLISREQIFSDSAWAYHDSPHVEALPVPRRARYTPFDDELPSRPLERWYHFYIPRLAAAVVLGYLYYIATLTLRGPTAPPPATFVGGVPFKERWTGIAGVDAVIKMLVSAFTPLTTGEDPAYLVQIIYFLPMLTSQLVIWITEANRRGNNTILGPLVKL
jgi:hypothetical protein